MQITAKSRSTSGQLAWWKTDDRHLAIVSAKLLLMWGMVVEEKERGGYGRQLRVAPKLTANRKRNEMLLPVTACAQANTSFWNVSLFSHSLSVSLSHHTHTFLSLSLTIPTEKSYKHPFSLSPSLSPSPKIVWLWECLRECLRLYRITWILGSSLSLLQWRAFSHFFIAVCIEKLTLVVPPLKRALLQ